MPYRLAAHLPLETRIGEDDYVVELVSGTRRNDCWLRARSASEPVVFLLAHFPDRAEAQWRLTVGFDLQRGAFPRRILENLVAVGEAAAAGTRPPPPPRPRELAEVHELELAGR